MSIEKFQPSYEIYNERFEKLKAVVPEVFEDGKINFDLLKESLGTFVEEENPEKEHYSFVWPGKREARRLAGKPPQGCLIPLRGEGVNDDKAENVIIEGDNLEVLKLMQKSYAGKIKMIYIDPPYNTGSDFIYNDSFEQPLDEYLKLTGQIDEKGNALVSNRKSDGRFHSKWMNMMYPRLFLAHNLLKDDGVIFISIDGHEVDNLRKICNEIFGEENLICSFVWEKRYSPPADTKDVGYVHEEIIFYRKSPRFEMGILPFTEEQKERYKNPDKDERGPWKPMDYTCRYTAEERPNLYYPIKNPNTGEKILPKKTRVWAFSKEVTDKNILEKRIWWGSNGKATTPALKNFISEVQQGMMPMSLLNHEMVGHTDEATKELRQFFPELKYTPKPVRLIKHLEKIANPKDSDIVLDFFAGSGTTAQAVLESNAENGNNVKFILIQLPEQTGLKDYPTIDEITKERVRLVIKKLNESRVEISLFNAQKNKDEIGFKIYELKKTNFKIWKDYKGNNAAELMDLFSKQEGSLVDGWKKDELIFEIMLQEGFPLHSVLTRQKDFKTNEVIKITSDFCEHALFICLNKKLDQSILNKLSLSTKDVFICLDSALTDEQKVILKDKGVIKTI